MYCNKCGNELTPEDRYCPSCGAKVAEKELSPAPSANVFTPETAKTKKAREKMAPETKVNFLIILAVVVIVSIIALVEKIPDIKDYFLMRDARNLAKERRIHAEHFDLDVEAVVEVFEKVLKEDIDEVTHDAATNTYLIDMIPGDTLGITYNSTGRVNSIMYQSESEETPTLISSLRITSMLLTGTEYAYMDFVNFYLPYKDVAIYDGDIRYYYFAMLDAICVISESQSDKWIFFMALPTGRGDARSNAAALNAK